MNEIQLKICDIQGRLFELSAEKKYDSINFIKAFMMSNVAKARFKLQPYAVGRRRISA